MFNEIQSWLGDYWGVTFIRVGHAKSYAVGYLPQYRLLFIQSFVLEVTVYENVDPNVFHLLSLFAANDQPVDPSGHQDVDMMIRQVLEVLADQSLFSFELDRKARRFIFNESNSIFVCPYTPLDVDSLIAYRLKKATQLSDAEPGAWF